MKNIATIGRILFALPFGIIGLNHFLMKDIFLGMMTSLSPGEGFTILLTGAILIAASICLILNKFIKIVCFTLAGLLLLFIVTIHIPHLFSADSAIMQEGLFGLLKDTGLMGGALIIAAYYHPEDNAKA